MFFKAHCMLCGRNWEAEFPYSEVEFRIRWDKWSRGSLIQEAFPELTPIQREAMMTGSCKTCYERYLHG